MNAPPDTSAMLNTETAARRIGVSAMTLRRMLKEGKAPPSIVPGRRKRLWPEAALIEWVRSRTTEERSQ
ncbi:hypothetical protein AA0242T_1981 [Acetobacter aceti NRIC 0242]|uniref:Helix-turn-helix domain-containing protein n=2 Tax=Acetobacter aceti TaxID=435 RepID=A0AB33IHG7_ACEAC|nr:helix-turn-helix domain-containing protein [Acetobacter aceti]BCK76493.1 hypothetical protein EMQ_2099 [Acetobacter aceti NBRC 14818]BCK77369.1 hypothetical protein EMQ_2975 [Acetobacter aceti NBRC 14818]GBO81279.1 hypothetical protein AA0242T_1981 [Acetobacter aceti NRIC 0242]